VKIEQLAPGQIVYDVHSHRMGNTTLRSWGVWRIRIHAIAEDKSFVEASWNGNRVEKYYPRDVERWKKNEPRLVSTGMMGQQRRMTRAEIKAEKEKAAQSNG
jgi:hypothetical protein